MRSQAVLSGSARLTFLDSLERFVPALLSADADNLFNC